VTLFGAYGLCDTHASTSTRNALDRSTHPSDIMQRSLSFRPRNLGAIVGAISALAACGSSDTTEPVNAPDKLSFTTAQVKSLDSTGQVIVQTNPNNGTLRSLVDSTLLVFTVGVEAKRVDVTTNLTAAPMYWVGIHRAISRATGSFSTWTLVGMDDPSHLGNLIEVSGFAQSSNATPPASISGTIGDGTGSVNGLLLQVANGGVVTQWNASSGTVSFSSDAPAAPCPNFTPTPNMTCALETMHVHFGAQAATGSGGASGKQAAISPDVAIPAMRLTYTP
jgi:hypothetical protein